MATEDDKHLWTLMTLLGTVRRYEPLTQDATKTIRAEPRSSLWGDDAKSHPYEISQGVWHALTVSVDHFQCLRSSLQQHNGRQASTVIHMNGQYSLVRGALENAARAIWVLEPSGRAERLTRRLRLTYKELNDSHKARDLLKAPTNRRLEDRLDRVVNLVSQGANLSLDEARKTARQAPSYKEIVRDAGARLPTGTQGVIGADACEAVWRACSSLAHGDSLGSLNFLERKVIESDGRIALIEFTGSIPLLTQSTYVAVRMIERAFDLFKNRATNHV